ncbi:MAG: hypothetical protein ACXWFO_03275, partial [Candidatus Aminicenantales bacterium]
LLKNKLLLASLTLLLALAGLILACMDSDAPPAADSPLQFLPGELAQREQCEKFLETAEVVGSKQMIGEKSVTSPWVLTLKLGDVTHRGLWKNPEGRMGGYWEGWTYEIAAYRLDKCLGLGLVPPTVERRFNGDRGSCQYWIDDCMSLLDRDEKGIKMPQVKVFGWNRATYLQRLFDNLIANEDRHKNQILITPDWRMVLIDHSRSFRTAGKFVKSLLYSARNAEGPMLMSELPRTVVEKVRALDAATVKSVVGEYLTDEEIRAVVIRRDLILAEIDRLIEVNGEKKVLY